MTRLSQCRRFLRPQEQENIAITALQTGLSRGTTADGDHVPFKLGLCLLQVFTIFNKISETACDGLDIIFSGLVDVAKTPTNLTLRNTSTSLRSTVHCTCVLCVAHVSSSSLSKAPRIRSADTRPTCSQCQGIFSTHGRMD